MSKELLDLIEKTIGEDINKIDEKLLSKVKEINDCAINEIGELYDYGVEVEENFDKARVLYEMSISLGNKKALCNLGWLYYNGQGVDKDDNKAKKLFNDAINAGEASAFYGLGYLFKENGDFQPAIEMLENLIKLHEEKDLKCKEVEWSYTLLGDIYIDEIKPMNFKKGMLYYSKAIELGSSCAARSLGDIYYYGKGIEKDLDIAKKYYEQVIECENCLEIAKNRLNSIEYMKKQEEEEKVRKFNLDNLECLNKGTTKFFTEYDDGNKISDLIEKYLEKHNTYDNKELIIGYWEDAWEDDSEVSGIVETIVKNKDKFKSLESVYFGDMDSEECEISWIVNTNLAPLVNELKLKSFTAKGGNDLRFENMRSESLKELIIISGGTNKKTIQDIINADIPNLEKLELYLGDSNYGFDAEIEDLKPFMQRERFPKLKYLGIKNSEIQDEICNEIFKSNILEGLEVLDMSYGTLSDKGADIIIENIDKLKNLKEFNIEYNFISEDLLMKLENKLEKLNIKYLTSQEDVYDMDEEYRSPFITE